MMTDKRHICNKYDRALILVASQEQDNPKDGIEKSFIRQSHQDADTVPTLSEMFASILESAYNCTALAILGSWQHIHKTVVVLAVPDPGVWLLARNRSESVAPISWPE